MNALKNLFYLVNLLACLTPTFVSTAKKDCPCDTLEVFTSTTLNGTATINATSTFNGAATFNNPVTLNAAETVNGTATFNAATTFNDVATFNDPVTLNAAETVNGPATFNAASTFNAAATFNNPVTLNASETVNGTATFNSTVVDNGPVTMNNNLTVGSPSNHPSANFDNAIVSNLAPTAITVNGDPLFIPNGFDKFNKIQDALSFIQNKNMPPSGGTITTTITIMPGTYPENVVVGSLAASDLNFVIQGIDHTRNIVGVGYANGSFWNVTATPDATVGGGIGSNAVFSLASNTLTITNSTAPTNGNKSPNFAGANGVVPGDKVLISDGTSFAIYTVQSVGSTSLTFTTPVTQTINGNLAATMTVLPTVIIAPPTGTAFSVGDYTGVRLTAVTLMPPTNGLGYHGFVYSNNFLGNVAIVGGRTGISLNNFASLTNIAPFGISVVGATNTALTLGYNVVANATNSLFSTPTTAARNTIQMFNQGAFTDISQSTIINNVFVAESGILALAINLTTIISPGGTALEIANGSRLELFGSGELFINDLSTTGTSIGIDVRNAGINIASGINPQYVFPSLSLKSANSSFIGVRLGGSETPLSAPNVSSFLAGGDQSFGKIAFNSIVMQNAGNTSYIAQVLGGSSLTVEGIGVKGGSISLGANSNGFLVDNASSLIWRKGNITGNGASTLGTLFDIERGSTMVLPAPLTGAGNYLFSNYPTLFNVNANSKLYGNSVTTSGTTTHYIADILSDIALESPMLNGGTASVTLSNGSRLNAITPTFNNGICPANNDNTGQIILSPGSGCPNQCPTACS